MKLKTLSPRFAVSTQITVEDVLNVYPFIGPFHVVEIDGVETIVCWGADHVDGYDAKSGKKFTLKKGETVVSGPFELEFEGLRPHAGPNYNELQGRFAVSLDGRTIGTGRPGTFALELLDRLRKRARAG